MIFESNRDLKKYSKWLISKLMEINEKKLAEELKNWENTDFTTSSELLGEFMLILEKILKLELLDGVTRREVKDCVLLIKNSLSK